LFFEFTEPADDPGAERGDGGRGGVVAGELLDFAGVGVLGGVDLPELLAQDAVSARGPAAGSVACQRDCFGAGCGWFAVAEDGGGVAEVMVARQVILLVFAVVEELRSEGVVELLALRAGCAVAGERPASWPGQPMAADPAERSATPGEPSPRTRNRRAPRHFEAQDGSRTS